MVGIGRVPVDAVRHRCFGNSAGDDVSSISRLLAVDDEPIVYRSVGADDDVVGADDVTAFRRNFPRLSIFDFFGVNAGVDATSVA